MMVKEKDTDMEGIKKVVAMAISHYNVNHYLDRFSVDELQMLCRTASVDLFNDASIIDNDVVRTNLQWERMDPKRLCRLMARLIDQGHDEILAFIQTKDLRIRVRDIKALLLRQPQMIERFNINMGKLTDADAHSLLILGSNYFFDKITIEGRRFISGQQYEICKAYEFERRIMLRVDPRRFDGFHVAEILKCTGRDHLDILDLSSMKLVDWLNLLSESPDLYDKCPIAKFHKEPLSQLIDLATLMEDDKVYALILECDLKDVSPFGWEKLMSHRPDLFADLCDYNKLDAMNKRRVLEQQPQLDDLITEYGSSAASSDEEP